MKIETPSVIAAPAQPVEISSKKHLRGSSLLLVGRIIAMAMNFAIQVLIVRHLSKSDYGAFAYVVSLISLGSSLVVFGLDKTLTRFVPIYQEKGDYPKLFGAIVMMVSTVFSLGFFLVVLVFGLQNWISATFINDRLAMQLLLIMIFLSPIQALDSLLVGMLAVFVSPRSIFFRRHVLDPGLKLLVIVLFIYLLNRNVYYLTAGYVLAGVTGVALYAVILIQHLRKQEYAKQFSLKTIKFPFREVFSFSLPLLTTNFVYLGRHQLVVVLLEYFQNTVQVASYRAVQPVGDLNTVVIQSFGFLFMPMMARIFVRKDQKGINDLYWQSAVWIAVISFPIFLVTFALAKPLTILLFGQRYAQSGIIMALLAFGYYFNAALGFNADTLRIYGKLRYTVMIDFIAMGITVGLSVLLIPRYGAVGAAIATTGTLVIYNVINQVSLKYLTEIKMFQWHYLRVYGSIALGTLILVAIQASVSLSIYLGVVIAGIISLTVLFINRDVLNIEHTFPELLRFKIIRVLLATDHSQK
jgi:O-antigen/teichoic acid export membrane protein